MTQLLKKEQKKLFFFVGLTVVHIILSSVSLGLYSGSYVEQHYKLKGMQGNFVLGTLITSIVVCIMLALVSFIVLKKRKFFVFSWFVHCILSSVALGMYNGARVDGGEAFSLEGGDGTTVMVILTLSVVVCTLLVPSYLYILCG